MQSVDFFTPVVNDPRSYGRIAAANALSDIYAMGARPLTALSLIGFPPCLDHEILVEILRGGVEKVKEAGAVIVGGHTIEDDEPKAGLAVTGLVDPRRLVSTVGALPGDRLVLTKPLGTGILATALKGEVIEESAMTKAIRGMETLNRAACEAMIEVGASACTDITGFSLLGHALELAEASKVRIEIDAGSLPLYPDVMEMAALGLVPVGSYRNREHYLPRVENGRELAAEILDVVADPQTSGGLLIAVNGDRVDDLLEVLKKKGAVGWPIGRVKKATKAGLVFT